MKSLTDSYKLRNGVEIPCVGFGTWQVPSNDTGRTAIKAALEYGYRHIDTAAIYRNEDIVGQAVRESGIPRGEVFVTSKLWNDDYGYESTKTAFHMTLHKLGMDYLDLYLMHWPNPIKFRSRWRENNAETWRAIEELYEEGLIRAIGVSNFMVHHLEELFKTATILPMVNQLRLAPGDVKVEEQTFCKTHGILLEAYSPLGTGKVFDVPELKHMGGKYGKTVAQLCLRWSLDSGFLPLPKSITPKYIAENRDIFDFTLSTEDIRTLAGLTGCCGMSTDPDTKLY